MTRYTLNYSSAASKAIQKLPRQVQQRILMRLELLSSNPRGPGSTKLGGQEAYRIRVGDYRIVYTIEDEQLVIVVIEVGHRREVYRRR